MKHLFAILLASATAAAAPNPPTPPGPPSGPPPPSCHDNPGTLLVAIDENVSGPVDLHARVMIFPTASGGTTWPKARSRCASAHPGASRPPSSPRCGPIIG